MRHTQIGANIVVPELEAVLRPKMKRAADEDGADIAPSAQQQQRLPPTKQLKRAHQGNVFSRMAAASQPPHASASGNDELEHWDQAPIVGTSQRLEKRYLRLTSAPDPTTVRPLPVLRQTMALLKRKWKAERDYGYICDQFKSVRQDLTVQMVRNEFTVEVYEVHARIALEKHDLGEYNQCQSQLAQLYGAGIAGHRMEFMAYRLLYFLYTKNRAGVYRFLKELTEAEKQDPAVKHALVGDGGKWCLEDCLVVIISVDYNCT